MYNPDPGGGLQSDTNLVSLFLYVHDAHFLTMLSLLIRYSSNLYTSFSIHRTSIEPLMHMCRRSSNPSLYLLVFVSSLNTMDDMDRPSHEGR